MSAEGSDLDPQQLNDAIIQYGMEHHCRGKRIPWSKCPLTEYVSEKALSGRWNSYLNPAITKETWSTLDLQHFAWLLKLYDDQQLPKIRERWAMFGALFKRSPNDTKNTSKRSVMGSRVQPPLRQGQPWTNDELETLKRLKIFKKGCLSSETIARLMLRAQVDIEQQLRQLNLPQSPPASPASPASTMSLSSPSVGPSLGSPSVGPSMRSPSSWDRDSSDYPQSDSSLSSPSPFTSPRRPRQTPISRPPELCCDNPAHRRPSSLNFDDTPNRKRSTENILSPDNKKYRSPSSSSSQPSHCYDSRAMDMHQFSISQSPNGGLVNTHHHNHLGDYAPFSHNCRCAQLGAGAMAGFHQQYADGRVLMDTHGPPRPGSFYHNALAMAAGQQRVNGQGQYPTMRMGSKPSQLPNSSSMYALPTTGYGHPAQLPPPPPFHRSFSAPCIGCVHSLTSVQNLPESMSTDNLMGQQHLQSTRAMFQPPNFAQQHLQSTNGFPAPSYARHSNSIEAEPLSLHQLFEQQDQQAPHEDLRVDSGVIGLMPPPSALALELPPSPSSSYSSFSLPSVLSPLAAGFPGPFS